MDGQAAIRGGIPVCFPQFNQRGPAPGLPKHGFARLLPWASAPARLAPEQASLAHILRDSQASRAWWDEAFEARLDVVLSQGALQVQLTLHNPGATPWAFTGALHTYLALDDIAQARLDGLGGCAEWDAVTDRHGQGAARLRIEGEFDRVYAAAPGGCLLHDGPQRLAIEPSPAWAHTVVWNPGARRCASLADMPADGWQRMLCVEAAQVFEPIVVAPGGAWQGAQRLQVR